MHKLSREQADWLIKAITSSCKAHAADAEHCVPCGYIYHHIEGIINQCIEEKFPEFTVDQVNVGRDDAHPHLIAIWFSDEPSPDGYTTLNVDEFKDFTQGCQAIVSWLEEQE